MSRLPHTNRPPPGQEGFPLPRSTNQPSLNWDTEDSTAVDKDETNVGIKFSASADPLQFQRLSSVRELRSPLKTHKSTSAEGFVALIERMSKPQPTTVAAGKSAFTRFNTEEMPRVLDNRMN